jgi:hypothetical protein
MPEAGKVTFIQTGGTISDALPYIASGQTWHKTIFKERGKC